MRATETRSKSRLGRNLSTLLYSSEEALSSAMGLRNRRKDDRPPARLHAKLPLEALLFRPLGKDQPDGVLDFPVVQQPPFNSVEMNLPTRAENGLFGKNWHLPPIVKPKNPQYRITFAQQRLDPDHGKLRLEANHPLQLGVTIQLPVLASSQAIPPLLSGIHVYLLLVDPEKKNRVQMDFNSLKIEPGKKSYDFPLRLDNIATGSWMLSIQIYVALYGYSVRRILHLTVG